MAFDVQRFVEKSNRLEWQDLDLAAAFSVGALDDDTLRCLQYMHDIESHTVCYLREALVTSVHDDPALTTFLTTWNYEEFWHGEAIGEVLRLHGYPSGFDRVRAVRDHLHRRDRWRPLTFMAANLVLPDLAAIQMVWGAVNEFTTQAAYGLLGRRANNPAMSELLKRIMRQEGRHIDFYFSEAHRRLSRSRRVQQITRFALQRFWRPVGQRVRPPEETDFVIRYLFDSTEGALAASRIDRQVDRLPGLSGLGLVTGAARQVQMLAA